ncbi:hypothetical protein MUG84_19230 [Paenibacillus sp. KQZ6P-2]|uniref:Uncharacterized protein n=1 Tax=Paenibacillus mangrovi TaxID=2931978 RepID=A0A9X2B6J0_9BACL|nr:hypothetical protein [Paenibacillus mangrovi]MCJ8013862.1 hypothetical protein [Paenibacillus mangrovi]
MENKNSALILGLSALMLFVAVYLVFMVKPQTETATATHIIGGSLDIYPKDMNNTSFPKELNVKSNALNEQIVPLGDNRFAVIDGNTESDTHGTILIYEYDAQSGKLKFLTSDNYVMRMNQRTE